MENFHTANFLQKIVYKNLYILYNLGQNLVAKTVQSLGHLVQKCVLTC